KVALITGGGQGIGKDIALRFAREGADVAVVDINLEAAEECAAEVKALGRKAIALKVDVSNSSEVDAMVKQVTEELGALDILVNNAGITRDKLLLRMEDADWDAVMSVNLKGSFNCLRAAVKVMSKARYGRIINIASIVGLMGNAGQANYSASKAGLIGLTKTTAREFASRGVTCNAVAPGFIDTAMTQAMPEKAQEALTAQIPLKRLGTSKDVSDGVLFLASDASSYITGHVLSINGGMYM
ncbi:MAG: 3-oxoacyl-[acyl-carrier-protein] reductase, partial [Deltaproteobacteria bacterium]|nr:3-oxoacyl-[acyl-carrier-protein] reductase [Deltaproteobacteria bacterium]